MASVSPPRLVYGLRNALALRFPRFKHAMMRQSRPGIPPGHKHSFAFFYNGKYSKWGRLHLNRESRCSQKHYRIKRQTDIGIHLTKWVFTKIVLQHISAMVVCTHPATAYFSTLPLSVLLSTFTHSSSINVGNFTLNSFHRKWPYAFYLFSDFLRTLPSWTVYHEYQASCSARMDSEERSLYMKARASIDAHTKSCTIGDHCLRGIQRNFRAA